MTISNSEYSIQLVASFDVTTTVSVYELTNAGNPSNIYFAFDDIPNNGICRVNSALMLPSEPVFSTMANVRMQKFLVQCNDISDMLQLYIHYGLFRCGGVDVTAAELLASSDDNYMYQFYAYAVDLPELIRNNGQLNAMYTIVQQLSFDIANYTDAKRVSLTAMHSNDMYPKLRSYLAVDGNYLTIECKDTDGYDAAKHISRALGVAEETVTAGCYVRYTCIDENQQLLFDKRHKVANEDENASAILTYLPLLDEAAVGLKIAIDYYVYVYTLGITLTFSNAMILSDEQLAPLIRYTPESVAYGYEVFFRITNVFGSPIPRAKVYIDNIELVTPESGIVVTHLHKGLYTCRIQALNFVDYVDTIHVKANKANVANVIMDRVSTDTIMTMISKVTVFNKESKLKNKLP